MQPIHQRVPVTLSYTVHFTTGLFAGANPLLAQVIAQDKAGEPKKILAVLDRGVWDCHPGLPVALAAYACHYPGVLALAEPPLVVPGGEQAKNDPGLVTLIHEAIDRARLCRHSFVLGIGGGAVLDLVGYAAATAHRGVRLIRVPTTVLAQNDSGIGVKNGINGLGKKNFLGTFAPPYAVINDRNFLTTLEDRDWHSGIAEAVKVALIRDREFFDFIAQHTVALRQRDPDTMAQLIYRCAQLHLQHIATGGDPFEQGSSRPLDFGHWAAHRLEHLTQYRLRHGEAVAVGMALDATYSYLAGWLAYSDWERVLGVLEGVGLACYRPECLPHALFPGLEEFREHLGGRLTLTLLAGLGQGVEVHAVDWLRYQEAIALLSRRSAPSALVVRG
ncbi:3-dehydroquinate synthase [Anthocerotibacter panamensis]|uniref:3-dehydroquinate synthase n=1 Tax=Anthocerotibacter panamensis TaxID=2857077 RepID=UPI001C408047|nr:3-dehydroquinate synthase [Anthocerotibacter panamensis]